MRRDISGDGLFKKGNCMNSKWMRLVFLALFASCFAARTASPVTTTGTILGTVMDPSGGAVPGAEVVIINANTGELRSYTTDSSGGYEVPELKPGTYTIRAKAPGSRPRKSQASSCRLTRRHALTCRLRWGRSRKRWKS